MATPSPETCPECGARLTEGARTCDLCGLPVDFTEPGVDASSPAVAEAPAPAELPATPPGVYCNQCGWQNPPGARFCSMCGSRLQTEAAAPAPPLAPAAVPSEAPEPPRPPRRAPGDSAVARQVGIIIGAGVLLVVVLFLVTAVSKRQIAPPTVETAPQTTTPATPPAIQEGALPPLAPSLAGQAGALEAEIEQLTGAARLDKQRQLINLYFGAGRLDHAALEQQAIAESTGQVEEWKRAGDLFYDWMSALDGGQKAQAATQAIAAYQRVLAEQPDNLDVRTDMATAYLSTNNPMQGVQEIRRVLDADSTHLHARFNYGIMLALIGRSERAIEQFERVKTLVDESSPYYQQANDAIASVRAGANL